MLSRDGYTFDCVSDGQQALERVTASPASFDIVITDHHMPHLNGLTLVERLRQTTFFGKILVFSSVLTSQHRVLYQELGSMAPFLSRPKQLSSSTSLQNSKRTPIKVATHALQRLSMGCAKKKGNTFLSPSQAPRRLSGGERQRGGAHTLGRHEASPDFLGG